MGAPAGLIRIIEASIEELLELRLVPDEDLLRNTYIQVLLAYLQGNTSELAEWIDEIRPLCGDGEEHPLPQSMLDLAELRLMIRRNAVQEDLAAQVAASSWGDPLWRGECSFVAAMAYEYLKRFDRSRDLYGKASRLLDQAGAHRKAVKALHNYITAETNLHPDKRYMTDYHLLYRKARKARDLGTAGMALLNLSREHQKLGASGVALKYCNRALVYLERERGSRCHAITLAHRAHLLAEAGRITEGRIDCDEIRHQSFPEVRAAVEALDRLFFNPAAKITDPSALLPTWLERLPESVPPAELEGRVPGRARLGELEERLLQLLSERPRDKFELISALYGEKLSLEVTENRLKNLLNRMRRKRPGAIILEGGRYQLVDASILPRKASA